MALKPTEELPIITPGSSTTQNSSAVPQNRSLHTGLEDKVAMLKEEIETLKREVAVLKKALRDQIARYEISLIKQGKEMKSIVE